MRTGRGVVRQCLAVGIVVVHQHQHQLLASAEEDVRVVTFDGAEGTTFEFVELNDPVMGGVSVGRWSVGLTEGRMVGRVKDVPSLEAPGFIKASADGTFANMSAASALVLEARSRTPEYGGFRVSLASGTTSPSYACSGGGSIPYSRGCYKAAFNASDEFAEIVVPFSQFSDLWSPATGDLDATCRDDASACLTPDRLAAVVRIEFWAEGVDGDVDLEIRAVKARVDPAGLSLLSAGLAGGASLSAGPTTTSVLERRGPPRRYDECDGPIQADLRYGISGRVTTDGIPVAGLGDETLAQAVCCDARVEFYAEPQFLYEAPDVDLFGQINTTTVFYDSVCGLPLFQAPVNRSLDDFIQDTQNHGWPSFRQDELFAANLITNTTTSMVSSVCGTHLGSFLPDAHGDRWCIDLSCIAGNPPPDSTRPSLLPVLSSSSPS